MKYLILDGPPYPTDRATFVYRGTDRKWPPYSKEVPHDHEINELWSWSAEENVRFAALRDLAKARRYAQLANEYFPGMNFEVIGITEDNEPAPEGAQFLGYDIGGGASLIFLTALPLVPGDNESDDPAVVLDALISRHFQPRLNEFGLFPTYDDAANCRRAMIAVQSFRPNFYEGGSLDHFKKQFEVTGVYLISDTK